MNTGCRIDNGGGGGARAAVVVAPAGAGRIGGVTKMSRRDSEESQAVLERKEKRIEELEAEVGQLKEALALAKPLAQLGELSATIAHEIRNPLAGMYSTVELLCETIEGDEFAAESFSMLLSEIERLEKIVNTLLSYARTRTPVPRQSDLTEDLERALFDVEDLAMAQGVTIERKWPAGGAGAFIDAELTQQAFLNILLNAIQSMPEGGRLAIGFQLPSAQDKWMQVEFQDTGRGITAEDLGKVFDPFFTTKTNGVGLGLAITHKIIEQQGGRIAVNSVLGSGTTVTVCLPAAK